MEQSRVEAILSSKLSGEAYDGSPQSRVEELLLDLDTGGGGGGGTDPQVKKDVETLKADVSALKKHSLQDSSYETKETS